MMRKILGFAFGLPFAITLFLAFAGAIIALFGGMAGLENARVTGGTLCGIGVLGFFVLLLSPYEEIFSLLNTSIFNKSVDVNDDAVTQPYDGASGKKDS